MRNPNVDTIISNLSESKLFYIEYTDKEIDAGADVLNSNALNKLKSLSSKMGKDLKIKTIIEIKNDSEKSFYLGKIRNFAEKNKCYKVEINNELVGYKVYNKENSSLNESTHYISGKVFKPAASDLKKMRGYYDKGSNPRTLANTVKDLDKAQSRYFIAVAMGWNDCASEFRRRCLELGSVTNELDELNDEAMKYEVPDMLSIETTTRTKRESSITIDAKSNKVLESKFKLLHKLLERYGLVYSVEDSKSDKDILSDIDQRNGKCETKAYKLKITLPNSKEMLITLNNHENASISGGSFGVSAECTAFNIYCYEVKQEELAKKIEAVIKKNM